MNWSMLRAILILPGNVLVIIPAIILWLSSTTPFAFRVSGPDDYKFWLALCLLIPGVGLSIWTSRLFLKKGEGTPAPWDPPRKLVVLGPYQYVRNPMITSVLINGRGIPSLSVLAVACLDGAILCWQRHLFPAFRRAWA